MRQQQQRRKSSLKQFSNSPDTKTLMEVEFAVDDKHRFNKSTVERSPVRQDSVSPTSSSQRQQKMTSSQFVFDETSGKHYVLKEIETSTHVSKVGGGNNEPLIYRRTLRESVSPTGKMSAQHDLTVTGFMNYKQRQSYAAQRDNGQLRVASPRSLLRKSTEKMYLPQNDKFEGYSQFPRPRVPPETKKIDSFSRRKVSQSHNSMTMKELLELQALRKAQKKKVSQQTAEFITENVGYLTGTHTGANNKRYTKPNNNQVRKELAEPKAVPKTRNKLKSDFKKDGAQIDESATTMSSRNNVGTRASQSQLNGSKTKLDELNNRMLAAAMQRPDAKNSSTISKDGAINELDNFIRNVLKKDPKLPQLQSLQAKSVMYAVRKSERLKTDKDTVRNLKKVLSMRDSMQQNQAGNTVNGRKLLKPVPLKTNSLRTRQSSGQGGGAIIQDSPSHMENPMLMTSTMTQNMSMDNVMASGETLPGLHSLPGLHTNKTQIVTSHKKIKSITNQSALNLLGSSSKRSLFNFAASKAGGIGSEVSSMAMIPGLYDAASSQISLFENKSPRKASQPNSSVFSLNRYMNDQLLQSQRGSRKSINVTHEQLVEAKKRRSIIPGYQSMKPDHRVDTFLSKDNSRNNSQRNTSQNQSQKSLGHQRQKSITSTSKIDKVNGSKGRNSPSLVQISSVEQLNCPHSIGSLSAEAEDEYMISNPNSGQKSKNRYVFSPFTTSSPFSRQTAGFSCFGQQTESQPAVTSSAVKSLNSLKQAMIVPYKEKKASPIEKLQPMKRETKGRFTESAAIESQAVSVKDKEWTKRANPDYIKRQKDRAVVQETLFKKRQLTKTLIAVREEYKAGILVSKIPPELAEQVKNLL